MPFPTRLVPERTEIREVFSGNSQNILEKASVSHMVGILQQLNFVSKYSTEVFGDIFAATEKTAERIKQVRTRVKSLESRVPQTEKLFVDNSPMFFYDNPHMDKEYARQDAPQGLLFRRERSTQEVNRRRAGAEGYPNFTALDRFSIDGTKNITKFSDSKFFINEWLAAEERKIREEKKKRKAMRAERKARKEAAGTMKRAQTKKVLQVKRKRYDPATGKEIIDDEEERYTDVSTLSTKERSKSRPSSAKHSMGGKSKSNQNNNNQNNQANIQKQQQIAAQQQHQQKQQQIAAQQQVASKVPIAAANNVQAVANIPRTEEKAPPDAMKNNIPPPVPVGGGGGPGGPPAVPPAFAGGAPGGGPGGPPPPNPMMQANMIPPSVPNGAGGGPPMVPPAFNNGGPGGNQLGAPMNGHNPSQPSYAQIPAQQQQQQMPVADDPAPKAAMPAFLLQLQGAEAKANLRRAPQVERKKVVDKRSAMLAALQGKKTKKSISKS